MYEVRILSACLDNKICEIVKIGIFFYFIYFWNIFYKCYISLFDVLDFADYLNLVKVIQLYSYRENVGINSTWMNKDK